MTSLADAAGRRLPCSDAFDGAVPPVSRVARQAGPHAVWLPRMFDRLATVSLAVAAAVPFRGSQPLAPMRAVEGFPSFRSEDQQQVLQAMSRSRLPLTGTAEREMTVPSVDLAALSVFVMRSLVVAIARNPILIVVLCAAPVLWKAAGLRIHSDLLLCLSTALGACSRGMIDAVSGVHAR